MTLVQAPAHAGLLDHQVDCLVEVVSDYASPMPLTEAKWVAARALRLSVSQMAFVVNAAVADGRLRFNLRDATLATP